MPSWLIKAGLQGAMSVLPQPHRLNYLLQRHVSKRLHLTDAYFEGKVANCRQHLEHDALARPERAESGPASVLELGTGWLPMVPVGLALCGVERVVTVDVTGLLRPHLVAEVLDAYVRYHERGRLAELLPRLQPERMDVLRSVRAKLDVADSKQVPGLLRDLGIEARVGDARTLPDESGSIQCFVSNTTLEHIPPDVLRGIFAEFRRVGTDDAVMSHFIDLSDHYAHFDRSITPYHFLRYAPGRWRWYNNTLQYQNRLRVSDYRQIHAETGFEIVHEANATGSPEQIGRIVLAPEFEGYAHDDLVVINSWMVSVPGAGE